MIQFHKITNIINEWMEGGQEEQWRELLGKVEANMMEEEGKGYTNTSGANSDI